MRKQGEFNNDGALEDPIGGTQWRDDVSDTEKLGSGVSIQNVVKRFGDVAAVNGVTFDIMQNEFFSILRPSGCGKTDLQEPDELRDSRTVPGSRR